MKAGKNIRPFWLLLALPGCGDPSSADTSHTTPSPSGSASTCGAEVMLQDNNNYSLTTQVDMQLTTLAGGVDLTFDWTGLTKDIFGHPVNAAADIDLVLLSLWQLSPEALELRISTDTLSPNEQKGVLTTYPDGTFTSRNLYQFNALDPTNTPLDPEELKPYFDTARADYPFPPSEYTFLVIASAGTAPGQNARTLSMFKLDSNAPQSTLQLNDTSASLVADANLSIGVPVAIPAAVPNISVNWKEMTKNALGNTFEVRQITKAVVLHFATATLPELEQDFLNLEQRADQWYQGEVAAGTRIDLSTLVDNSAGNFAGITAEGIWMVALFCTKTCNNPAPWSVTVLQPCTTP